MIQSRASVYHIARIVNQCVCQLACQLVCALCDPQENSIICWNYSHARKKAMKFAGIAMFGLKNFRNETNKKKNYSGAKTSPCPSEILIFSIKI